MLIFLLFSFLQLIAVISCNIDYGFHTPFVLFWFLWNQNKGFQTETLFCKLVYLFKKLDIKFLLQYFMIRNSIVPLDTMVLVLVVITEIM